MTITATTSSATLPPVVSFDSSPVPIPASGVSAALESVVSSDATPVVAETAVPVGADYLTGKLNKEQKGIWAQESSRLTRLYGTKDALQLIEGVQSHPALQSWHGCTVSPAMFNRVLADLALLENLLQYPSADHTHAAQSHKVVVFAPLERELLRRVFDSCTGAGVLPQAKRAPLLNKIDTCVQQMAVIEQQAAQKDGRLDPQALVQLRKEVVLVKEQLGMMRDGIPENTDRYIAFRQACLPLIHMEFNLRSMLYRQALTEAWAEQVHRGDRTKFEANLQISLQDTQVAASAGYHYGWQLLVNDQGQVEDISHQTLGGRVDLGKLLDRAPKPVRWLAEKLAKNHWFSSVEKRIFASSKAFIDYQAGLATLHDMLPDLPGLLALDPKSIAGALTKARGVKNVWNAARLEESLVRQSRQFTQALQAMKILGAGEEVAMPQVAQPSPMSSRGFGIRHQGPGGLMQPHLGDQQYETQTAIPTSRLQAWRDNPSLIPMQQPDIIHFHLPSAGTAQVLKGERALDWLHEMDQKSNQHLAVLKYAAGSTSADSLVARAQAQQGLETIRAHYQAAMLANDADAQRLNDLTVLLEEGARGPFSGKQFKSTVGPQRPVASGKVPTQRLTLLEAQLAIREMAAARGQFQRFDRAFNQDSIDAARVMVALMATQVKLEQAWRDTFAADETPHPAFVATMEEIGAFMVRSPAFTPEMRAATQEVYRLRTDKILDIQQPLKIQSIAGGMGLQATVAYVKTQNAQQEVPREQLELSLDRKQTAALTAAFKSQLDNGKPGYDDKPVVQAVKSALEQWLLAQKKHGLRGEVRLEPGDLLAAWPRVKDDDARELVLRFEKVGSQFVPLYARRMTGSATLPLVAQAINVGILSVGANARIEQIKASSEYVYGYSLGYLKTSYASWQAQAHAHAEKGWGQFLTEHEPELKRFMTRLAQEDQEGVINGELTRLAAQGKDSEPGQLTDLAAWLRGTVQAWHKTPSEEGYASACRALTDLLAASYPIEQREQDAEFSPKVALGQ